MKPIAILGAGPAGLMAAHAVGMAGRPFGLFSEGRKSVLGGAQFLHKAIPVICDEEPEAVITITATGDSDTYRRKVYGELPEDRLSRPPFVSFPDAPHSQQPAWNLRAAYDKLWNIISVDSLNQADITPEWIDEHSSDFDLIISTIPLSALCRRQAGLEEGPNHRFTYQPVQIAQPCDMAGALDNFTIVYDGTDNRSWSRASNLWQINSVEFGQDRKVPVKTVTVQKPIANNCTCYPEVVRAGRFGEWRKGVLTHDAFTTAIKALMDKAFL